MKLTYQGTLLAVYYCLLMLTVGGKANNVNYIIIITTNNNKPHRRTNWEIKFHTSCSSETCVSHPHSLNF